MASKTSSRLANTQIQPFGLSAMTHLHPDSIICIITARLAGYGRSVKKIKILKYSRALISLESILNIPQADCGMQVAEAVFTGILWQSRSCCVFCKVVLLT